MPNTTVINQPLNGNLGDYLISCLEDADFDIANIIVAFAKNSGVLRLKLVVQKSIFLLELTSMAHHTKP